MAPPSLWMEVSLIPFLIALNGFFSGVEIAVVNLRRSRLAQLVNEGRRGASAVSVLKQDAPRFLATVQVAITIVSSTAAVIGGAAAVAFLEPRLRELPLALAPTWAGPLALGATVLLISCLTLVLGELVPKTLGLQHTETLACLAGPIVYRLSILLAPVVGLLKWSTHAVLRVSGSKAPARELLFSEEAVQQILREGTEQGVFDAAEQELIHSVFDFTDTSVREVMVPRADIHAVEIGTPLPEVMKGLLQTGFSRAPVYRDDLDHIVGLVHIKDLLRSSQEQAPPDLAAIMHPVLFVPDSMQISDLLRDLQSKRTQMAIVLNEFGTVIGLVTIEDLLEEIVGEIRDEFDTQEESPIQQLPDGSLLVEGSVLLEDLKEQYGLPLAETPDYRTIAGFALARLRRIPKGGEAFEHEGLRMTIVVVDDRRLRKVRIERTRGGDLGTAPHQ